MSRRLFVAAWVVVPVMVVTMFGFALTAAWYGSARAGWVAFVLLMASAPAITALGFWTVEEKPARNLPRADRKRLREHERAARLQAEIERVDRELGLTA